MGIEKESISIFEEITKTKNGKSVLSLKEIKTDGTPASIRKTISVLEKACLNNFQVIDKNKGINTFYRKTLSGKNYEKKIVKLNINH